ncbi:MAG TPA: hypothetical protein VJL84_12330 [Kiloniellales bacterium]|nr:hypothetical protein [Kiloniellales bacterium]
MKTLARFGGLGAALLLAGCQGAPVVRQAQIDSYVPQYAAAMSQLEFVGTAGTPEDTQRLAEVAAKGISQGSMAGPQFTLRPRKPEEPELGTRVVVVVGGAAGATLCAAPPRQGGDFKGGTLHVAAAACSGGSRLTSTSGSVSGVEGPDDPAVAHLFRQIGAELFPMRNPNYEDNDHDRGADWNF